METLFLTYANSSKAYLSTLSKEEEEFYSLLSRRAAKHDFIIHKDASATIDKVCEFLIGF